MVWFQCESCGENLKKPKLQNHFRGCAARKLSCIDCGVVFDQQSVQVHTSCVSETEKYGPKDGSNGSAHKPKTSQPHSRGGDFDLSVGLSTSPPWNCSLCKVNATSYETLEGHSQGKKHRAKAKAVHAKLNSTQAPESLSAPNSDANGSNSKPAAHETNGSGLVENGKSTTGAEENVKKRKSGLTGDQEENAVGEKRKKGIKAGEELQNASENGGGTVEESAPSIAQSGKAIKWKKLTTKALLKAPEKRIKLKKLLKELLPVVTLGTENPDKKALEKQLVETLNASSKFELNGKWVALAN